MPIFSQVYTITNWLNVCTALGDILTFVYTSWYRSLLVQPLNVIFSLLNVCLHCRSLSTSKIFVHAQIFSRYANELPIRRGLVHWTQCKWFVHPRYITGSLLKALRTICSSAVRQRFVTSLLVIVQPFCGLVYTSRSPWYHRWSCSTENNLHKEVHCWFYWMWCFDSHKYHKLTTDYIWDRLVQ